MAGKIGLSSRQPEMKLNGLAHLQRYLAEHPNEVFLAVVKLGVSEIRTKVHRDEAERAEAGEVDQIPVLELLAAEIAPAGSDEKSRLAAVYSTLYFDRTGDGNDTLPDNVVKMPAVVDIAPAVGPAPTSGIPAPAFAGPEHGPGDAPS